MVRQEGAEGYPQPGMKRRVYHDYNKEQYKNDLRAVARNVMNQEKDVNPRAKLMQKRHQDIPEDQFKNPNNRALNLKKPDEATEFGMGLFLANVDREKAERELKKKAYQQELARQIMEQQNRPKDAESIVKINNQPPPPQYNPHRKQSASTQQRKVSPPQAPISGDQAYYDDGSYQQYMQKEPSYSNQRQQRKQSIGDVSASGDYLAPARSSPFQQASKVSLNGYQQQQGGEAVPNYARRQPPPPPVSNEFFEKNFGQALERKKVQNEERKAELVNELQTQIMSKKEREKREKMQRDLEDMRAEERYLADLKKLQDQNPADAKKKPMNIFADGLNDADIPPNPVSISKPKEPSLVSAPAVDKRSLPATEGVIDRISSANKTTNRPGNPTQDFSQRQGDLTSQPELSFGRDKEGMPTLSYKTSPDALALALQQQQNIMPRYVEYGQRVQEYHNEKYDDKKKELRMNTNLLYQQLIDLRAEKNYTENLKNQAFQNYDNIRRNVEKQNRVLANEIGRLGIDAGDSSTSSPVRLEDRTYNPRTWGQNDESESNQRYGEFRKQGLAMVDDLLPQTRFGASAQSDTRQGIEPAEDEFGEIDVGPGATGYASKLLQADTKLISIGKPKPDPRPLSQLDVMDVPEFENRVTLEVRQDRIVEKLSKLPPEFRLEELKRKNLDFETLMNEMVKECRHIYEDQVGIKPIRKGEPEDTLDQIIENLYNDDFKIKNLPPKAASTATEDILSPAPRYVQAPYHSKMYNMNIDPAAQLPHDSSHFDPSKTSHLSTSPLTPSKQGPANSLPLAAADDSFGMSPHSDPHNGHLDGSSHEPNPYLLAAAHRAESSPNGDNPFKENNDERGSGEDSPTFGKSGEVPFGQKEGAEKGEEGEGEEEGNGEGEAEDGGEVDGEGGQEEQEAADGDEEGQDEQGGEEVEGDVQDGENDGQEDGDQSPPEKPEVTIPANQLNSGAGTPDGQGSQTPSSVLKKGALSSGSLANEKLRKNDSKKKVTFPELPDQD